MRTGSIARLPERGSPLGPASWAREMQALALSHLRPPDYPLGEAPRGDGHTVLVLPGFLTGDWTTARLRGFLSALGYRVSKADVLCNIGPTRELIPRLERRILQLSDMRGQKVSLVGQSLGGVFARGLAQLHPGAVRSVVTLCSPIHFPVTTALEPFVRLFEPFHDPQWLARAGDIAKPPGMPVTAIYSREDGIVDWRQCLQDEAPGCINIGVAGSHTTMGSNPEAQRVVAEALAKS